ncbi:MAG: hypothetical protein V1866_06440 [archaeon]
MEVVNTDEITNAVMANAILKRTSPLSMNQRWGLGAAAFALWLAGLGLPALGYAGTPDAQQNKPGISSPQGDNTATIPPFSISTYDSNHNLVTIVKEMQGANLKSPPRIVPCGGSFGVADNNGSPIIHIKKGGLQLPLDMVISEFNYKTGKPGEPLHNPLQIAGSGEHAFPAFIENIKNYGLKDGTLYVAFPAIEDGRKLLASVPTFVYTEKCCDPVIKEKIVDREVEKKVLVDKIVEKEVIKRRGGALLDVYSDGKRAGLDLMPINFKLGEKLRAYFGVFGEMTFPEMASNNLQYDEFNVKGQTIIGRTDLESTATAHALGGGFNLVAGREGKTRFGLGALFGYEWMGIEHKLIQTARDKLTGADIKDPYECIGNKSLNGLIQRYQAMFMVPLKGGDIELVFGAGVRIGQNRSFEYAGTVVKLDGNRTTKYGLIGVRF